tara:strand:- start:65905 stop:71610 length:5706 start_codon:yes stop_codon:yes gene_type:complete
MDIVLNSHFNLNELSEITTDHIKDVFDVPEENAVYVTASNGTSTKLGNLLPLPAKDVSSLRFDEHGHLQITTSDDDGRSTEYDAGRIFPTTILSGDLPTGVGLMTNSGTLKEINPQGNLSLTENELGNALILSSTTPKPATEDKNRTLPGSMGSKTVYFNYLGDFKFKSHYQDPDAIQHATFEFSGVVSKNCRLKLSAHNEIGSISQISFIDTNLKHIAPYQWLNTVGAGTVASNVQIFEVTLDEIPADGVVNVVVGYAGTKDTNIEYTTAAYSEGTEPDLMTCVLEQMNADDSKLVEYVSDVAYPFLEKYNEYSKANRAASYKIHNLHYEYDGTRYRGIEDLGDRLMLVPRENNSIIFIDKLTQKAELLKLEQNWPFWLYCFTGRDLYLFALANKKIVKVNIETREQLIWDAPSLATTLTSTFYIPHFKMVTIISSVGSPHLVEDNKDIRYFQFPIKSSSTKMGTLSNRPDINIFPDMVEYFNTVTSPELSQQNIVDLGDGRFQLVNQFGDKVTVSTQYHHASYSMEKMFEIRSGIFLFHEQEVQPEVIFEFAEPTEVLGFAHGLAGDQQTNKNFIIWVSNDGSKYNLLFNYEIDYIPSTVANFRNRSDDEKIVKLFAAPLNYKFIKVMFTKLEGRNAATHGFSFLSPLVARDRNLRLVENKKYPAEWELKQCQDVLYAKDKVNNEAMLFNESGEIIMDGKFTDDLVSVQPRRNGFLAIERTYGSTIIDATADNNGSWYFEGTNRYGGNSPWMAFDANSDPDAVYKPGNTYRNLDMGEITPENSVFMYVGNKNRKIRFDKIQYNAGIHNPKDFKIVARDNTEYTENRNLWKVTASGDGTSNMPATQLIKPYLLTSFNNQGSATWPYNHGWRTDAITAGHKPWVQIEFDKEIQISSLQYFNSTWPSNFYHDWVFECSSDGVNWRPLVVDQTKGYRKVGVAQESFVVFNPQTAKFFRATVGADKTSGNVDLCGLKFNLSEWEILSTQSNDSNLNETRTIDLGQFYEYDEVGVWCDSTLSTARIVTFYEFAPIDSSKGHTREAKFLDVEIGGVTKEIPLDAREFGEFKWLNEHAKSITTNQQVSSWGAQNLKDITQSTWWNAGKVGPYHATFEFEEKVSPNEFYIQAPHTYYRRSGRYNYYFKGWTQWEIHRSDDGNNWSTLLEVQCTEDGMVFSGPVSGVAEDISVIKNRIHPGFNTPADLEESLQLVKINGFYSAKYWRIHFPAQGNSNNEIVFGGMGLSHNQSEMRNVGHYHKVQRKIEALPMRAHELDILQGKDESKYVMGIFGAPSQLFSLDATSKKFEIVSEDTNYTPEIEDAVGYKGEVVEAKVSSGGTFPYQFPSRDSIVNSFDSLMGFYINPGTSAYKPKEIYAVAAVEHDVDNKFNIMPSKHWQCLTYDHDNASVIEFNNPCIWRTAPASGATIYDQWCSMTEKVDGNTYIFPSTMGSVGRVYPVGVSIDLPKFTNPTDGVESTLAHLESNMGSLIGKFVGDVSDYLYYHTVNFEMQKELANPLSCFDVKRHGVYHYNGYVCFGYKGAERSWTLELNRVMNVDGFVLGVMVKADRVVKSGIVDIRSDSYHVEVSMDGETWTELGAYYQSVDGIIPDTDPFYYLPTIKGTATTAKFVRVTSKRADPLDIAHGIFDLKLLTPDTQMVTTPSERAVRLSGVELSEAECRATVQLPDGNILICPKDGGKFHIVDTTAGVVSEVPNCDLYKVTGDVTHAFMNENGILYVCSLIGTIYKFDFNDNYKLLGEITSVTRTVLDSVLLENGYRFLLTTFANSEGWVLNVANDVIIRKSYVGMTTATGYFSKLMALPGNRVLCFPDLNSEKSTFEVDVDAGIATKVHDSISNRQFMDVATDDKGNGFVLSCGTSQGTVRRNMYIEAIDTSPLPPELVASKNLL